MKPSVRGQIISSHHTKPDAIISAFLR